MISQVLSSTVKVLATYNAFTTSILSVMSANPHRTVHSTPLQRERLSPDIRKKVEKIKGPRPKQPLSPYFRFMQQIRPQVVAEYPNLRSNQLYPIFSERWKSLEAGEKVIFSAEYQNDMHKYLEEISQYNREMSRDQMQWVQKELAETEDKKLIKVYKERARHLNKPKRPPSSFLIFLHTQPDRRPDEPYKDYTKRMASRWWSMDETERKKYETTPKEKQKYKKAMLKWEANLKQLMADGSDVSSRMVKKS